MSLFWLTKSVNQLKVKSGLLTNAWLKRSIMEK